MTQAVVGGNVAESYSFDAVGNRLTSLDPASYTYNSSNQLTASSSATYAYDSNGNTTSKTDTSGTTYYTWDYENRLASVTLPGQGGTVYFNYDPMGRRIRKVFGSATTIYAYDGDNITEELDSGGNLVRHYTQGAGIDQPLALTGTGGTYYYHADGRGSITSITNGSGNIAASYEYDSFGKLTASTGTVTNPFQYTGREFDPETGLYYYRARYYDLTAGRFLSEDPIRFRSGINFYAYVQNNPVSLIDPRGLCVDQKKLADCIFSLFGVVTDSFSASVPEQGGSFTGEMAGVFNEAFEPLLPGPSKFTVTNLTTMTVSMLSDLYGKRIAGLTDGHFPFINFTASDMSTQMVQKVQIFELGNSLGYITGKQFPPPGTLNVEPGPGDNEPGAKLLKCMGIIMFGGPKP